MESIHLLPIIAQSDGSGAGLMIMMFMFAAFAFSMIMIVPILAGMWKIFTKIGKPGWAALIPVFNIWVLVKFLGKEDWWVILFFIPVVSLFASFVVFNELSHGFGKGTGFTIGIMLVPFVFIPLLGFGSAQYSHGGHAQPAMAA